MFHHPFPLVVTLLPSPWQPLIVSVSMDLHILDISYKWNLTVCGLLCLPSFSIISWRFTLIIALVSAFLLFTVEYYMVIFHMPHIISIHEFLDMGVKSLFLAIVKNAAMNIWRQILCNIMFQFFWGICLGVVLLHHMMILSLTL